MKPFSDLGIATIETYRLMLGVAFAAAVVLATLVGRWTTGARTWKVGLAVGSAVLVALPGARLLAWAAEPCGSCASFADLWSTRGGSAFLGGFAMGTIAVLGTCRRLRIPFAALADAAVPAALVGLAIGRFGCLGAGCCYGRPTTGPLAVVFERFDVPARPVGVPLHPTQLYEALLAAGVAAAAYLLVARPTFRARAGSSAAVAAIAYGAGRFLLEFLRADVRGGWAGLSTSQWGGLLLFGAGIAVLASGRLAARSVPTPPRMRPGDPAIL